MKLLFLVGAFLGRELQFYALIIVVFSFISIYLHQYRAIQLFVILGNVKIKFDQNHYRINLFQNYFVDNLHHLINLKYFQSNFDLNFARKDLIIIPSSCSLNSSF